MRLDKLNQKELTLPMVVSKMHRKEGFCFDKLRGKLTRHVKTEKYLRGRFYLRQKGGYVGVECTDNTFKGVGYIRVSQTRYSPPYRWHDDFQMELEIHVSSNKEFLEKLLKHNLLNYRHERPKPLC